MSTSRLNYGFLQVLSVCLSVTASDFVCECCGLWASCDLWQLK